MDVSRTRLSAVSMKTILPLSELNGKTIEVLYSVLGSNTPQLAAELFA